MSEQHLATYLNDHLAGSELGLELLEHLERTHSGTPLGPVFAGLKADVAADRRELEALMARLQITASGPRKAAAWASEKAARLKLWLDDSSPGPLRLLEGTEAVSLGIEGKRLLWRALAAASEEFPQLRGPDYALLEGRAEDQRRQAEAVRREAAKAALGRP